jgi:hypothetical protein
MSRNSCSFITLDLLIRLHLTEPILSDVIRCINKVFKWAQSPLKFHHLEL